MHILTTENRCFLFNNFSETLRQISPWRGKKTHVSPVRANADIHFNGAWIFVICNSHLLIKDDTWLSSKHIHGKVYLRIWFVQHLRSLTFHNAHIDIKNNGELKLSQILRINFNSTHSYSILELWFAAVKIQSRMRSSTKRFRGHMVSNDCDQSP